MGRLPHPAGWQETKEKAPRQECLLCSAAPGPLAYTEVRAVLIPTGILHAYSTTKVNYTRMEFLQILLILYCNPGFDMLTMGAAA